MAVIPDFLIDHAVKNVWCTPFQDSQAILKLSQVSKSIGAIDTVEVLWEEIVLPSFNERYSVYQVGANHFLRFNWPAVFKKWTSILDWSSRNEQIFDIYNDDGFKFPLSNAFIYRNNDNNLLIAIKHDPGKYQIKDVPVYLRCYRNSFFNSSRSDFITEKLEAGGGKMRSTEEIQEVFFRVGDLKAEPGYTFIYHNGYMVQDVFLDQIKLGDYLEYVYDSSVKRILDFKLTNLRDFMSEYDNVRKYLFHPPKDGDEQTIRYRDDIEVYLYAPRPGGRNIKGCYYHRNMERSVRMVTHFDYSMPVETILSYFTNNEWLNQENCVVRIFIRESGYNRPIVFEANRIKELYRLDDEQIVNAMCGIDAVIDEWRVEHLENSPYTALMRKWYQTFSLDQVLDAYGYNSISKLVADTPMKVEGADNAPYVQVPIGLQLGATMFEYDANGLLLGYSEHPGGDRYYAINPKAKLIEGVVGVGGRTLDWTEGNDDVPVPANYNYRLYVSTKKNDVVQNDWKIAVENTNYQFVDGKIHWIHNKNGLQGLVLTDKRFLINEVDLPSQTGVYRFSIVHSDTLGVVLPIRPEKIDIWLNGNALVEGIDYYINWPEVMLVSKGYLQKANTQKITLRCLGFSEDNGNMRKTIDKGFTMHGLVSYNNHYDTRDDKVMRIVVGGKTYHRSAVNFAEDYGTRGMLAGFENGLPYEVSALPVPIRQLSPEVNRQLRQKATETDKRLEDYLTLKYPQAVIPGPVPVTKFYLLYSPLITRILWDINIGSLTPPYIPEDYDQVQRKMKPYMDYLPYEPTRNNYNRDFSRVLPHPFDNVQQVNELTFRFIEAINKFYLGGQINLSPYFSIKV